MIVGFVCSFVHSFENCSCVNIGYACLIVVCWFGLKVGVGHYVMCCSANVFTFMGVSNVV